MEHGIFRVRQFNLPAFRIHRLLLLIYLKIDEEQETVYAEGREIELTDTEYAMLHLLIKYRHQIFSAERLYEAVWDEPYYYGANNTIMVHIRNLRKKIEKDARNPVLIKTIWGKGYRCD